MRSVEILASAGLILFASNSITTRDFYSQNGKYQGKMYESPDGMSSYYGPHGEYTGSVHKLKDGEILLYDKKGDLVGRIIPHFPPEKK